MQEITIRGHKYSDYRLTKMFTTPKEATKLRGWDAFTEWNGLCGNGQLKKEQLSQLYDELHAETIKNYTGKKNEHNDDVNRLIVFNRMREIVAEDSKRDFSITLTKPNGLSANLSYRIDGHELLTKLCTPLEEQVIERLQKNNYIDNHGVLQSAFNNGFNTFLQKEQQYQTQAQTKIAKCYKNYSTNYQNELKVKTIINDMMQAVDAYFKLVPTAEKVNGTRAMDSQITFKLHENYADSVINKKFGNCGEQAFLLYQLIQMHPQLSVEIKQQAALGALNDPDDHGFLIIGDPNSDNALIADPWLKFINLKPTPGYRDGPSLAINRNQGFLGSKAQYMKFLNAHEDGRYVTKLAEMGGFHEIITRVSVIPPFFYKLGLTILAEKGFKPYSDLNKTL